MNIIRTSVMGLNSLGAFGVATDKFAIMSEMWPTKAVEAITKALEVPITKVNIGDTSLVGILIAANSNGILLPHIFSPREMEKIEEAYGDSLNRVRLSYDGRYSNWFQAHVDFDNQLHFGNLITQPEFDLVRENLGRYVRGEPLLNVVDKAAGY